MLKNYLRVALRNLLKNKSYVIINTFGLGISLACCITAYILVGYNLEFDNFHSDKKVENIFRVHSHVLFSDGNIRQAIGGTTLLAPSAAQDIAGINRFTRYSGEGASVSYDVIAFGEYVTFADSTFFEMFDFPLISGNHEAFKDKLSIFINEETAIKYYGDEDPIGKILTLKFAREVEVKAIVGGVIDKVPINSTMVFRMLMRFEHFEEMRLLAQQPWDDWNIPSIFVELSNPDQSKDVAKLFDKYIPVRNEAKPDQEVKRYSLEPYKSPVDRENLTYASPTRINMGIGFIPLLVFSIMALLILLIACFNLTNTSIAMTAGRLKEIGVRKSVGAHKSQIIFQFMLETLLIMTLSVLVGYGMSHIIVPKFTTMWDFPFGLDELSGVNLSITLFFIVIFASILAGIYPAFFNSKFNSIQLLKGSVKIKGTNALTKTLVALQFAISVIVLIAGVAFIQNTKYQEKIKFGYDKEKIMTISIQNAKEFHAMKARAQANPKIQSIGVSDHHVGRNTYQSPVEYESINFDIKHMGLGNNYFETIGFTFIQGRPYDMESATDIADGVVINRECIKVLNMEGDPIGQQMIVHGVRRKVVGVVENFVDNIYESEDAEPFVFYPSVESYWKNIIVRADADDLVEVDEYLKESWGELYPTQPYESRFQEDVLLEGTRQLNGNMKDIFLFLTILGGFLSAAGIYSLASLNIAKRSKEIGIRKALGATVSNVVMLLNKEFIIILIVAGILGSLGGYYGADALLDEWYAFYKKIDIIMIVLCALFIFTVGITTTSFTIFRAAKANPVDTLRDE